MGFLKNLGKSVTGAVKGATKVISIKNAIGIATGQKSIGSVATEAGNRALQGVLSPFVKQSTQAEPVDVSVPYVPPATKHVVAKGIFGTSVTTGNDKVDNIIGGAISGAAKSFIKNDQGTKELAGAATGAAVEGWFEKYWYYVAGAVLALILLLRGKK